VIAASPTFSIRPDDSIVDGAITPMADRHAQSGLSLEAVKRWTEENDPEDIGLYAIVDERDGGLACFHLFGIVDSCGCGRAECPDQAKKGAVIAAVANRLEGIEYAPVSVAPVPDFSAFMAVAPPPTQRTGTSLSAPPPGPAPKVCCKCSTTIVTPHLAADEDERCWRCGDDGPQTPEERAEAAKEGALAGTFTVYSTDAEATVLAAGVTLEEARKRREAT
jgi:hypothetical protein